MLETTPAARVVLTTAANAEEAGRLARVLVEEGLIHVLEGSVPALLPDGVVRGAFERGADPRPVDRGHGYPAAIHG